LIVLVRLISRKFGIGPEIVTTVLRRLRRRDIEALSEIVLDAESFAEIRLWVEQRTNDKNEESNGNH
jgi:hypothetical protein